MSSKNIPPVIKSLIKKREFLRKKENYNESDRIRKDIEERGYVLHDTQSGTEISNVTLDSPPEKTSVSIMGSGEIQSSGRLVHEYVLQQMGIDTVRIMLITTPAGFQPNVQIVYQEYKEFFENKLINFHPRVEIVYANTKDQANNPEIISAINNTDYIVTGPGSPTYAVNNLKNTLLLEEIIKRVNNRKASLSLSSAAALAFSKHTLPVYEIYKTGESLHWIDGLNVYKDLFRELTVIPHFNNTEGGDKLDTSRCYMGKERFEKLLPMLPKNEEAWGIDEHTGVVINLDTKEHSIIGKGSLYRL